MNHPTNNIPAAPSGPYEDHRITTARNTLAESANAQAPDTRDDRSAAYWWGRCESTAINLLAVIDEGTHEMSTPDFETLSRAELIEVVVRQHDTAQRAQDVAERATGIARRALDVLQEHGA